jgi:hypothetical protein
MDISGVPQSPLCKGKEALVQEARCTRVKKMSGGDLRYVSDIAVTLMLVKPGDKYERVGQMDLPAFFWVQYASEGPVVVDVRVLHGDAEPPTAEYTVLPENVSGIEGYASKICFLKRDVSAEAAADAPSPVLALAVATGEGSELDSGFSRLQECLNPLEENTKAREFLDIKTLASQNELSNKVCVCLCVYVCECVYVSMCVRVVYS